MKPDMLGHLLVGGQFLGIGLSAYTLRFPPRGAAFWLLLCLISGLLGLVTLYHNRLGNWRIHPEPLQHAQLVTSGPYRWVRHPMYLCVILMLMGLALYSQQLPGYAGLLLASVSVIWKSYLEENYLVDQFAGYEAYRLRTKRVIPFVY